MLKTTLIVLAVVIAGFLVVVAMQPADFRVTRSALLSAPPAAVFAQVNDFHKWDAWSPWAKLDPNAKNTFSGPDAGPGASFSWAGNKEVGEGRMTITDATPGELVRIKLEFFKPFAATNTAEFTFKAQGEQTLVTWDMFGKNNFLAKAVGLFMNCDRMIGGMFEKGLSQMKKVVETSS